MLAAPASAAPGDYLVLDKNADAAGHLYRVSPDGSTAVEVPTGGKLVDPVALAYGPDRAVYIVDKSIPELGPGGGVPGPGIWRFVPGSDPVLFSGLGHLGGPTAGTGTNFSSPEDIAWNPVRRELDVVDKTFNGVLGVDPATGDRTEVAHGSFTTKPSGIAVAPDGKIYVADPDAPYDGSALTGGVFMYDVPAGPPPATTEVEVAHNGAGVHAPFADPTGIAVMPNGHLVVTDRDTLLAGRLIDVDPTLVATSAASAIAVTSPPPPGDGTSTNPLDKPTGVTVSGSDVVIADPHGPLPCWTSMACTPGDAEGLIARLALTNPTTGTLSFPGGKTAKELNAAFVDPVDVAIVPNTPPVAELTAPAVAFVGEAIVLDASNSTDADGDALTVDFDTDGDGIYDTPAGSSLTQSVIYASEGTRNVAVRVIDSHGAAAVMSVPVSVLVRPATGPGPDPQPGPTPGPGPALPPGPGGSTPDATSVTTPSSVTLADLLSPNGVVIPLTCSSDCTVTGTLDIAAKDLNSLTAVVRVVRLGNGSVKLKAGAKGKLRMKLTAKARKRLRAALKAAHVSARRKIRLNLTL
ncbi:MAG: SMP-30/Gluconolactonase/LRE-like region, partial [Thermoleophilaceae bacterium]|nr:SMP-30/Gluconolactonase/LRE-like region [Thermoleophilaceae bacterium]